jgi:thiamine pyrophosphokinase
MNCVIVCSGTITDYLLLRKYFGKADLVVCADGGALHLKQFGIRPDVIVGDLDSITPECLEEYRKEKVEIVKYPVQKDMTDAEIAVELALEKGSTHITFLGAMGTRLDHSLSNIFHLKKLYDLGVTGLVANERNEITLIDRSILLQREEGMKVTLLPLTQVVKGVTTKGLMYPLLDATMYLGSSWGVSNEFDSETAEITLTEGLLLIVKSRD